MEACEDKINELCEIKSCRIGILQLFIFWLSFYYWIINAYTKFLENYKT